MVESPLRGESRLGTVPECEFSRTVWHIGREQGPTAPGRVQVSFCKVVRNDNFGHTAWVIGPGDHKHILLSKHAEAKAALVCLTHPWSIAAVMILALNDHVFKGFWPGWTTGKLSDFAGLFFFPFIVITLAGIFFSARHRSPLRVGRVAFCIVAVWFAGAKAIPFIHMATTGAVSTFLGPVQIVRDPTDIIALLSLWPAWRLYKEVVVRPTGRSLNSLRFLVVGATVLVTGATQPPPPPPAIGALITHDQKLFAPTTRELYSTTDGENWSSQGSVIELDGKIGYAQNVLPEEVEKAHIKRKQLIVPGQPPRTYKLDGRKILQEKDGRWEAVWEVSISRQEYMRVAGAHDWELVDIAVVPQKPDTVVVAALTQGIIIGSPDGTWSWDGSMVGGRPPRAGIAELGALILPGQLLFAISAAFLAWILGSLFIWMQPNPSTIAKATSLLPKRGLRARLWHRWVRLCDRLRNLQVDIGLFFLALTSLIVPGLVFAGFSQPFQLVSSYSAVPLELFAGVVFVALLLSYLVANHGWKRFSRLSSARSNIRKGRSEALMAGATALAAMCLWDLGVIGFLRSAFSLACFGIFAAVVLRLTSDT